MVTISRRKLADQAARRINNGEPTRTVLKEIAAFLIDTGRKHEAELVARDIESALGSHGVIVATVVSARPLTADSRRTIKAFIGEQYDTVTSIVLRERIDETVIGGVRIELPDKQLDVTVSTKLDKLTV